MNGVLPLFKEKNMTSFDCISQLRKILHTKKIGHTGTLDPNVDGVLPICVGPATKISELLMQSGKAYRGSITLGVAYDTEDLDGNIIDSKPVDSPFTDQQIDEALENMVGDIEQIPPMFSAVKINGRKLYEYAREGIEIERPARTIHIDYFKQTSPSVYDEEQRQQTIYFEVGCSKGTYVRTLAVDFGKSLGLPAVMSSLTRIKSAGFTIDQCVKLSEVAEAMEAGEIDQYLVSLDDSLSQYPSVDLSDKLFQLVSNGVFLDIDEVNSSAQVVKLKYQNQVKALYQFDENKRQYRPYKMFLN
ncbi:tRNA pseudouridine(55) synthase TruB [Lentilactobacillus sp. SPB1-3]|uniref:tRNA pseudouridine(55) synthase TruB n=1 Tax=Lentilactobacillus terminaliae TaxID=3003483 RepID=A0ACD5DCF7_9LACO|nr:tRNA pseudouridine(55) synthase TruB [Lentilactobacillus sp. SPB1-3]MCZ0977303.1 tRNA pseudouridine(55) synthase TruB [Lentilactobacillus sp. SPB1-3]